MVHFIICLRDSLILWGLRTLAEMFEETASVGIRPTGLPLHCPPGSLLCPMGFCFQDAAMEGLGASPLSLLQLLTHPANQLCDLGHGTQPLWGTHWYQPRGVWGISELVPVEPLAPFLAHYRDVMAVGH